MIQEIESGAQIIKELKTTQVGVVFIAGVYLVDRIVGWILKLRKPNGNGRNIKIPCVQGKESINACLMINETKKIVEGNRESLSGISNGIDRLNDTGIRQEKILERIEEKIS